MLDTSTCFWYVKLFKCCFFPYNDFISNFIRKISALRFTIVVLWLLIFMFTLAYFGITFYSKHCWLNLILALQCSNFRFKFKSWYTHLLWLQLNILNLCVMLCFINQIYTQGFRQHNFVV
jgi:hypothetical protein